MTHSSGHRARRPVGTLTLLALLALAACDAGGDSGDGAPPEPDALAEADAEEPAEQDESEAQAEQRPHNPYPEGRIETVPRVVELSEQEPQGLAVDAFSGLFIGFALSSRVSYFTTQDGGTRYAGSNRSGDSGDGGLATEARLGRPVGLALDDAGILYIVDEDTHRVRQVDPDTRVITAFAGQGGNPGSSGDDGPATAAELNRPRNLLLHEGFAYIADWNNHAIRRVDLGASPPTIALFAGGALDGPATPDGEPAAGARLKGPFGLAADAQRLYFSESSGNKIRYVTFADGTLGTLAGTGEGAYGGDNGPALHGKLWSPGHLLHLGDRLLIADRNNFRLRVVVFDEGKIYSAAGRGESSWGDGPAHAAYMGRPGQLVMGPGGIVYFADPDNEMVRTYLLPDD